MVRSRAEVIIDNGTPVGESFVDDAGYCWTAYALTSAAVTGVRIKATGYVDCTTCISANPCVDNFIVDSCCGGAVQFFSAALPGVFVGDSFVDASGFCWSVSGTTPLPITNVVSVGTVYPVTDCNTGTCVANNPCPTSVLLNSCCKLGSGYSTLEILQAAVSTLVDGDTFVDTFGFCWSIQLAEPTFPNLSFIIPASEEIDCREIGGCLDVNPCPVNLYYTVQNCCTEEIETVLIGSDYPIDTVLKILHTIGIGCYKILSWSDTGTVTLTVIGIDGVSEKCDECLASIDYYCPGTIQCCNTWMNISGGEAIITGYRCDGTWIVDFSLFPNETLCMAYVFKPEPSLSNIGCCEFNVYNPSATTEITIDASVCNGLRIKYTIQPLSNLITDYNTCVGCVNGFVANLKIIIKKPSI